jgi:hypothetical protein
MWRMSYHRRSTGHFRKYVAFEVPMFFRYGRYFLLFPIQILRGSEQILIYPFSSQNTHTVRNLGRSKEEPWLGFMILGNGSEDSDPDLNEPDPIGVVRGTFFGSAWYLSLTWDRFSVRELNVFSVQKVILKWILLLGMGRTWIILFLCWRVLSPND